MLRLARSADKHLLRPAINVLLSDGARRGAPGAVDHQIDTERRPIRQLILAVEVAIRAARAELAEDAKL